MASVSMKKPCAKCSKGAGVTTCDGCQQSFCVKHFGEHRQELSYQIENIGQEHDLLRRDFDRNNVEHSFLARIDAWEQESIAKIHVAAEVARADLHELLERNEKEWGKSMAKITDQLQTCGKSDDYTETDIKKWAQQLQELRQMLECPLVINIDDNATLKSTIRLIEVHDKHEIRLLDFDVEESNRFPHERFNEAVGEIIISDDGLVATCDVNSLLAYAVTYGANRYSYGIHRIHFRINTLGNLDPFFGIVSSGEENKKSFSQNSFHGWWNLCGVVANGRVRLSDNDRVVRMGDVLTLTVNCNNQQISLRHHRTDRIQQLHIDLDSCPFPWRIVVELQSIGDCVRILQ